MPTQDNRKTVDVNATQLTSFVEGEWDSSIVPTLHKYIEIPNKSPMFDPQWQKNGHMHRATVLLADWARERLDDGMRLEVVELEGRTPLIFIEIDGDSDRTVLLYGHLDKQPEMVGWDEGYGPWTPVLKDDRLYGRGGADDGYSIFAALTAVRGLRHQGVPHARCVILIEGCEESGSYDLPHYVDALASRIGSPDLVVCLDSGCGDYERMWCTTSLRGVVTGNLKVELISEGVHSGDASGIVASSFRVLRSLLSELEDPDTGEILVPELFVNIPPQRVEQATVAAEILGDQTFAQFPFHPGVTPVSGDLRELVLNRTWRPALAVTGASGLPAIQDAGNVMRPETTVKLSLRLPPTLTAEAAIAALRQLFDRPAPYNAKVSFEDAEGATGWDAPAVADWLDAAMKSASEQYFGATSAYMGEGGTIPFMGMLGEKFPEAQFMITGVLGPQSNAHGPNEFLDIPTAKKLTCCVAHTLALHHRRS